MSSGCAPTPCHGTPYDVHAHLTPSPGEPLRSDTTPWILALAPTHLARNPHALAQHHGA